MNKRAQQIRQIKQIFLFSWALFLMATAAFIFTGCNKNMDQAQNQPQNHEPKLEIRSMYNGDLEMWRHIYSQEPAYKFKSAPLGVILPHHMIVGYEIAKFYKGLTQVINPKIVVLISPNHYQKGDSQIQTCQSCSYETIDGALPLEDNFIQQMVDAKIATASDQTFSNEHGVYAHAPFIKHFFPQAKFVPIILKWETTPEETIKLSEWLNAHLPQDAIVIASVDFSHYIPVEAADFHDISSFRTIQNFDYDNIYDLEIDSPPSISTITHLMELRGYVDVARLAHTNLQTYMSKKINETTSHQFISFYKGAKQPNKGVTIVSFGNIPHQEPKNGADLNFSTGWHWDISNLIDINGSSKKTNQVFAQAPKLEKFLRDLRGQEDRFFVGSDFLVFDLPGDQCLSKKQNGIVISFCKFVEGENPLAEELKMIKEQKNAGADFVYLLLQFKNKTYGTAEKKLTHELIDGGADIVVGRDLKQVLPAENYHQGIILPGLGDFITDPSLQKSAGEVVGIDLTSNNHSIYHFPLKIDHGYPELDLNLQK